ncbi:MAG: radical SAM protein [Candidatus Krumholzibacteriota bacterium]|nr:radical SAM protein [Candidatus Krumholzibacteriota bacterium]
MSGLLAWTMSRLFRTPPYLILFVSDRCWNRCRHCWYTAEWKKVHLRGASLDLDELSRLAASIGRIRFLSLTGGEAFLREDIVEIASVFARKTRLARYEIPTSGFDTDRVVSVTGRLLRATGPIPLRVDVSLDGTRETHDRTRNAPGGFDNALRTIRELRRIGERHDHFDLGVITTMTAFNQDEIEEIAAVVKEANPGGEWMINVVRDRPRDSSASAVDPARYRRAHEIVDGWIREGGYRGHRGHRSAGWLSAKNATRRGAIMRLLEGRPPAGCCAAGALAGVIHHEGTVMACESLDESFGNLRDHDFDLPAVWRSPRAEGLRAWIRETRCSCTHECFLSVSLLIQPRFWPELVGGRIRLLLSGRKGTRRA